MLKISRTIKADDKKDGALLRLEGQVAGPWVEELRRACAEPRHNGHWAHLVLDLTNVTFIDADGVALFRQLSTRQVSWMNCSAFVAEQLKEVANADD